MSHGQRAFWDAVPESERETLGTATIDFIHRLRGADGTIRLARRVRYTLAERPA